jgi:hypothetical protein
MKAKQSTRTIEGDANRLELAALEEVNTLHAKQLHRC